MTRTATLAGLVLCSGFLTVGLSHAGTLDSGLLQIIRDSLGARGPIYRV